MDDYEKVILITGGCGFIASHVVILFVNKYPQYKILNIDCLDYCSCIKNLDCIKDKPNYKFIKGNILSTDLVTYIIQEHRVDHILHFAAQSHVDNSFGNSITFTQNNILGTHVLLEAAKIANINLFLHISTDEVYGEAAYEDNVEEKVVLIPTNPYAASKAAAEFIVKSYRTSFNLPTIITRSNNIYGPHQYPEKIIPKFICRLLEGKKCCIHGDGSNKRNYLYVKDVAEAYDTIVHSGKIGSIYNIGSEFECSNLDVAKYLIKLIIYNNDDPNLDDDSINYDDHIEYVVDRNVNDKRYAINSEKLKKEMGWSNSVEWINGLKDTIAWYKENRNNWDSYQNALDPHPGNGSTIFSYHNNDNNDNNDDDDDNK